MNRLGHTLFVSMLVFSLPTLVFASELPNDSTVLDGDCYFYNWPYPSISPDGQWVAYVSNGYVCVCNVNSPAPRRIVEVPNSWTWPQFVGKAGESQVTGTIQSLGHAEGRGDYTKVLDQVTTTIHGLVWKYDSQGFVFGVQDQKAAASDGYFTTLDGKITKIAHIDASTKTRGAIVGSLSNDGKFLVSPGSMPNQGIDRPIIWNVADNRPRATCFEYLIPSASSDRWIGIEKDTEQLVIADKDFQVVQRFNEVKKERAFGVELKWSPDERFVIWKNQIGFDYFSNWQGFWMDLKTGKKKELTGPFMADQIVFTVPGGEFVECGSDGVPSNRVGIQVTGAHLTIHPEDEKPPYDVWRVEVDPHSRNPGIATNLAGNGPLRMSPDANLFALCLPQTESTTLQGRWHLMDRAGHTWRLPGKDISEFIAPYDLVGFADGGRKIIAYDSSRLFSIPVSSVTTKANLVEK